MRRILAFLGIVGTFAFVASAAEKVDAAKTMVTIKSHPNGIQMVIVPRDRFGNYIGPGYASSFAITVSSGSASAPADPGGNGTYIVVITYAEDNPPKVSVTFEGVRLKTDFVPPRRKHR